MAEVTLNIAPEVLLDLVEKSKNSYWYLASPYTRYSRGHHQAFVDASVVSVDLLRLGVRNLPAISLGHPLQTHGVLSWDEATHEFWFNYYKPFMRASCGMIIAKLPGWSKSKGVIREMRYFSEMGKEQVYLECYDYDSEDEE